MVYTLFQNAGDGGEMRRCRMIFRDLGLLVSKIIVCPALTHGDISVLDHSQEFHSAIGVIESQSCVRFRKITHGDNSYVHYGYTGKNSTPTEIFNSNRGSTQFISNLI